MRTRTMALTLSLFVPLLVATTTAGSATALPPGAEPPKATVIAASTQTFDVPASEPGKARLSLADVDPFTLVGLTWDPDETAPDAIRVRVREDRAWGSWTDLEVGAQPDSASDEARTGRPGTDPLITTGADGVEVEVSAGAAGVPQGLQLTLIDPGTSPQDEVVAASAQAPSAPRTLAGAASAPVGAAAPRIVTRAQWGADESRRDNDVDYNQTLQAMVIHHTDSTNSYSRAQASAQIRAVYAFHTGARGWSDIGYNFVVDRYGTIYEGRKGSLDRLVRGAHTGGFNTNTMGVAALGSFVSDTPPAAMTQSIAKVIAWKLGQYNVNPGSRTTLTSSGGSTARYPSGHRLTVPTTTMHRTLGKTACPGDALAGKVAGIAASAASLRSTQAPSSTPAGAFPVAGDWDGDGSEQPGWYRGGRWTLSGADSSGTARVTYGRATDLPVVGDWNSDGRDDIGVFRDGRWHLRTIRGSQAVTTVVGYGRSGDLPVVGRWPGTSQTSIGVVRGSTWYLASGAASPRSLTSFQLGMVGDVPVVGDWNGDGRTSPGVVRNGRWILSNTVKPPRVFVRVSFGRASDVALPGDWAGRGRTTFGVVRGADLYRCASLTSCSPTSTVRVNP